VRGIQRQLRSDLILDVTYVGTRGERILVNSVNLSQSVPGAGAQGPRRPYNNTNPNLVTVAYRTDAGDSKYESLQVRLDKRFSQGFNFGLSYTYASYLSDAGNPNGGGNADVQNYMCIACNWGPVPDDYKHVLSFNHVLESPFGAGRKYVTHGIGGQILGGWNLSGIWTARSGGRLTPTYSTSVSNSSGGGTQRPNRVASGNLASGQGIYHWFDPTAFVAPAQYTFGNSGTGILLGPSAFNVDMSLTRNFKLAERFGLNFRAEAFNTLNHTNFGNPNVSIGTASAGIISGAAAARIMQLAVKVSF
jgi:hypothetical protein